MKWLPYTPDRQLLYADSGQPGGELTATHGAAQVRNGATG
jgi:hypothetical protein